MSCCTPIQIPCCTGQTDEALASILNNFIKMVLGVITKTCVNGQIVWNAPCDPNIAEIPCFPKLPDEGYVCYLLRLMDELALFPAGMWDSQTPYCKNQFVYYNNALYEAIQAVPAGTVPTDVLYWELMLQALPGPPGPQGPPGPPGSGSTPTKANRTISVSDSATNTDELIFCQPGSGVALVLTLPLISSLDPGKYFEVYADNLGVGGNSITVVPTAPDTIEGNASYVFSITGESVFFNSAIAPGGIWTLG